MKSKKEREEARIKQRLHDAYLMGLRARNFNPAEMIKLADQLIEFSRKLNKSNIGKIEK